MIIRPAQSDEADLIFELLKSCAADLREKGIFQWNDNYPRKELVVNDIQAKSLYLAEIDQNIAGVITFDDCQSPEYSEINWKYTNAGKPMVIHRLAVSPQHQRKGIARQLMDFALNEAKTSGFKVIRLDAYSQNERTLNFYRNRGYEYCGDIFFPYRNEPFYCFEKVIQ